jgi:transposase
MNRGTSHINRLEQNPDSMRIRRETVEHPFGTIKTWVGYTHFLTKRLPKVKTEMSLLVLAYNLKRVINIIGVQELLASLALCVILSIRYKFYMHSKSTM